MSGRLCEVPHRVMLSVLLLRPLWWSDHFVLKTFPTAALFIPQDVLTVALIHRWPVTSVEQYHSLSSPKPDVSSNYYHRYIHCQSALPPPFCHSEPWLGIEWQTEIKILNQSPLPTHSIVRGGEAREGEDKNRQLFMRSRVAIVCHKSWVPRNITRGQ
jgi:hypothetical protein